jgi:hypothetical protein
MAQSNKKLNKFITNLYQHSGDEFESKIRFFNDKNRQRKNFERFKKKDSK